jgi:hypothetical protein
MKGCQPFDVEWKDLFRVHPGPRFFPALRGGSGAAERVNRRRIWKLRRE